MVFILAMYMYLPTSYGAGNVDGEILGLVLNLPLNVEVLGEERSAHSSEKTFTGWEYSDIAVNMAAGVRKTMSGEAFNLIENLVSDSEVYKELAANGIVTIFRGNISSSNRYVVKIELKNEVSGSIDNGGRLMYKGYTKTKAKMYIENTNTGQKINLGEKQFVDKGLTEGVVKEQSWDITRWATNILSHEIPWYHTIDGVYDGKYILFIGAKNGMRENLEFVVITDFPEFGGGTIMGRIKVSKVYNNFTICEYVPDSRFNKADVRYGEIVIPEAIAKKRGWI